jgi:hypothetical protein
MEDIKMADITMCEGIGCGKKETCYRFNALVSQRQSWSAFYECYSCGDDCEHYLKYSNKNKVIEKGELT